jgi:hypothetical protein
VTVEGPTLVQVPGEPARLLGAEAADAPVPAWWVEARALSRAPGAAEAAYRLAATLAETTGGSVWPSP